MVALSEASPPRGLGLPAVVKMPPTSSRLPTSAMSLTSPLNAGGAKLVTTAPVATSSRATLRRVTPLTVLNLPATKTVPAVGPATTAVTSLSSVGANAVST